MEKEEREREREVLQELVEEVGGERTLTPPIPDWIMGAGSRTSFVGYTARKKSNIGLGIVGEEERERTF